MSCSIAQVDRAKRDGRRAIRWEQTVARGNRGPGPDARILIEMKQDMP